MSKVLIGISGKLGAGKDTLCNYILREDTEFTYIRKALADPLKDEAAELLQQLIPAFRREHLDDRDYKERYRLLLMWWGTELRRKEDHEYWTKKFTEWYESLPDNTVVVVPDIRFINEVELIHNLGGVAVRLLPINFDLVDHSHASELQLDDYEGWDYIAYNTYGDTTTLKNEAETIVRKFVYNS